MIKLICVFMWILMVYLISGSDLWFWVLVINGDGLRWFESFVDKLLLLDEEVLMFKY